MGDRDPHSSDLRKGRHSKQLGLYFITKNLEQRASLSHPQRRECAESFQHFRTAERLFLHAFVIMPDHWHALLSLADNAPLDRLMHDLCRRMSYPSRQRRQSIAWQDGYHDHKVRADESVSEIVAYIEANPVRKQWVEKASDWKWSSAALDYADRLDRSFLGHERWR